MELALTAVTFLVVAGMVLSGYYAAPAEPPIEQRLRSLVPESGTARSKASSHAPQPSIVRRFLAFLGQYGLGGDDTSLRQTLSVAGIRSANAAMLFIGTRTLLSVVPALLILVPRVARGLPLGRTLFLAGAAWLVGHVLVNTLLKRRAMIRSRRIEGTLPDALDLMVVCLEAGLGLNSTIARVGEERSAMDDPLGNEFAQVALELREGRSRDEALRALGDRNGVEDLKALAALIVQGDRLGASMGKTLRAHADVLRTKRRQRAEEHARKLPIKILFPLAFFILPPLFVVTLGPALLTLRDFFTAMGAAR
jgi:tight adherence protein C